MIRDLLLLAVGNVFRRRLRSWLTVIGILIGTAAVVALISVGQGLEQSVIAQVRRVAGYNTLLISPRGGLGGRFQADAEEVRKLPGVMEVMPVRTEMAFVDGPARRGIMPLVGYTAAMETFLADLDIGHVAGRGLQARAEAVLGNRTARAVGAEPGTTVMIEDKAFEVVGVLAPTEGHTGLAGMAGIPITDGIFVLYEDLRELFPGPNLVQYVMIRLVPGADVVMVREDVRRTLVESGTTGAQMTSFADITEGISSILAGVQAFLAGIAGISLLVGGVGVMNTMYTAVLERTREVGLAKAVGAKRRHILWIFLFESGLMGVVGGALGLLAGFGLAWGAVRVAGRAFDFEGVFAPVFSVELALGALLFSFLVGAASGVLPAMRASRLPPADALRHE